MADRITLNRKLPVVEGDWDAGAAKRRIFEKHTNAEGELDAAGAADFFLIGDPDTGLKEDLHLPVGDIREGRSVIVAAALRAVRSRLAQTETLPDVAADVKERANDIAGAMLEEHRGRKDALATVHSWSTGVMLPVPKEIAAMFPAREGHTPHITLVHAPWTSPEQAAQILEIVASELGALLGEEISLGELGYFERFADRVAFVRPEVTAKVTAARGRIAKRVAELGVEVSRLGDEWVPHATLDVVETGLNFVGTLPTGTWTIDDVEVWHDDERRSVLESARADAIGKLALVLKGFGSKNWFVHNTLAHPLMELLEQEGFVDSASQLHDLTLPDERGELSDPAAFAAWLSTALARADAELDEDTIKAWLVEHISDKRKMARPRMARLKRAAADFEYLRPPSVSTVYRGLHNVPASKAGKLTGLSDPVRDKSWTTELAVAAKFASTEWCGDEPEDGCVGVVLVADADPSQLLLNHELLAALPGVYDQWDERWGETLESAIRDEREVLALGPLTVRTVKLVDMTTVDGDGDGQARLVQDSASRRYGRSPAVITTPKTMVEIYRADAVEIIEDLRVPGPDHHPDGWVEFSVTYSRAGNVQVYDGVREWRPRKEVFAQESMDSGRGNPFELRHSNELLSPRTVLGVARGCMRTFKKHPDNNHTWGRSKVWDQGLLEAVTPSDDGLREAFAPEVSLAYRILADRRPGTSDDGEPFDQIATNIIINSLAAEPKGKGGSSVRVHADSVDRADVVTRADAMLELASGVPSGTVYWDPASWVRYDGGQRESKKDETPIMMKLIQKLLEARGISGADAAAQLGIEASDFEALLSDPSLLTDEIIGKLATLFAAAPQEDADEGGDPDQRKLLEELVRMMGDGKMDRGTRDAKARAIFDQMIPPGEGEPPKADPPAADPKREDGEDVEIDGETFYVPAAAAAEIKKLREQGSGDGERADAAEKKLANADMIPRKDAAAMALEQGMVIGEVISLARASYGHEFEPEAGKLGTLESLRPEPRKDKDADGADVEVQIIIREDWELAALKGALGDDPGTAEFERIAKASPAARPELMAMRVDDARKIVASRAHNSDEALDSIARMRAALAKKKNDERDRADAGDDPIADAIDDQAASAAATRRAPAP